MLCNSCGKLVEGKGVICSECAATSTKPPQTLQVQSNVPSVTPAFKDRVSILPAPWYLRILAAIIDGALLFPISQLLQSFTATYLFSFLNWTLNNIDSGNNIGLGYGFLIFGMLAPVITTWLVFGVLSILYRICFEASQFQGTPGKIWLGLVVTDLKGERISIMRSSLRFICRYIFVLPVLCEILLISAASRSAGLLTVIAVIGGFVLALLTFGISIWTYLRIFFDELGQGLHDRYSGCVVQQGREIESDRIVKAIFGCFMLFFIGLLIYSPKQVPQHKLQGIKQFEMMKELLAATPLPIIKPKTGNFQNLVQPGAIEPTIIPTIEATIDIPPITSTSGRAQVELQELSFSNAYAFVSSNRKTLAVYFSQQPLSDADRDLLSIFSFTKEKGPAGVDFALFVDFNAAIDEKCDVAKAARYGVIYYSHPGSGFSLPLRLSRKEIVRMGSSALYGETALVRCESNGSALSVSGKLRSKQGDVLNAYQWDAQFAAPVVGTK